MAVPACLTQTTGRGLEGEGLRAAGGHLSGEGHGSVSENLDALVSVAEAALLLTASEYWFWEVEGDALLHLEGTAVVQAGQEASLGVGQGQCVVGIYLLEQEQVQAAGAGYLVPASFEPHLGGAGEEGAPSVHGGAAVPNK